MVTLALQRLGSDDPPAEIVPNMEWIATRKRLQGLLRSVSEELDTPLYYTMPGLCQALKCSCPSHKDFKAALINAGYQVSGYHKTKQRNTNSFNFTIFYSDASLEYQ
jgi:tRNA G26 N,N-dimethylase Trm1